MTLSDKEFLVDEMSNLWISIEDVRAFIKELKELTFCNRCEGCKEDWLNDIDKLAGEELTK